MMLFGFLSFEVPTLGEETFAGTNFQNFFAWIFHWNDFRYFEFTKDSTGFFAVTTSTKTLRVSNFVVALRSNFFPLP